VDFGTGDGSFVLRTARRRPDTLVVGVDANGAGLAEASRRALAKPARGGVANALFGVLALEQAPGELVGLADELTVLLPWGSLLAAVARGEALGGLRELCRPDARVCFVLGYAAELDPGAAGLPDLDDAAGLERAYREAGFTVVVRPVTRNDVRALGTTWAQKLAFSPVPRRFVAVRGRVRR
jgi:16S rRNA (adenine(1408)-N(1))-methyltransferase